MNRPLATAIVLYETAVALGSACGFAPWYWHSVHDPFGEVGTPFLLLLLIGCVEAPVRWAGPHPLRSAGAAWASLLYAIVVCICEAVSWDYGTAVRFSESILLLPFAVAMYYLVQGRVWFGTAGVVLFVLAGSYFRTQDLFGPRLHGFIVHVMD